MAWIGTAIGAALGFGAAVMPTILDIVKSQFDSKQQIAQAGAGIAQSIDAQTAELKLALDAEPCTGAEWALEFIKGTVRPTITYLFFGLFCLVKVSGLIKGLFWENLSIVTLLPVIWDPESSSLFAAVISFWFGSRAVQRIKGKT